MVGIAEDVILQLAKKIGREIAESAGKHFAGGSVNASGYKETQGRGGAGANGVAPRDKIQEGLTGTGSIGSIKSLNKHTKLASEALDDFHKRMIRGAANFIRAFDITPSGLIRKQAEKMDDLLGPIENAVARQSGIVKQMNESLLEYVRQPGTDLSKLGETSKRLEYVNKSIHNFSNNLEKINSDQLTAFVERVTDFTDATGKSVNLMEDFPLEEIVEKFVNLNKTIPEIMAMPENTDEEKKEKREAIATVNELKNAFKHASTQIVQIADNMNDVGSAISSSTISMLKDHRATIGAIIKGSMASAGLGIFQYTEDLLFRYQASISRQYMQSAALSMGASHREILEASLDFRDTLRVEAGRFGTDIYSDASEEAMKRIQNLGDAFGLMGIEAYRFGLQMKQTSQIVGMADADEKKMQKFYAETAKTLNMTVQEFGDYFSTMAKDPSFVSFVNRIRATSTNLQQAVETELTNRIRMNKILGLSNENLQERLRLEQSKKYAPMTERYRSLLGVNQLIKMYEKQLGREFSVEQKDALKTYALTPNLVTPEQSKLIQQLRPVLEAGPELLSQGMQKEFAKAKSEGNEAEAQRLSTLYMQQQHMIGMWSGMAGQTMANLDQSPISFAAISNMAKDQRTTPEAILNALSGGDQKTLKALEPYIASVTGELEKATGKDIEGLDDLGEMNSSVSGIYTTVKSIATGLVASAPVKAIGGAAFAVGSLGVQWMQYKLLKNAILGVSGLGMSAAGIAPVVTTMGQAVAGTITHLTGVTKGLGLLVGGLATAGGALLAFSAGKWVGTKMYEQFGDSDYFIDKADKIFGSIHEAFTWKKSGVFADASKTPEFDELTPERQEEVLQARLNRQMLYMQKEIDSRKADILGEPQQVEITPLGPEMAPLTPQQVEITPLGPEMAPLTPQQVEITPLGPEMAPLTPQQVEIVPQQAPAPEITINSMNDKVFGTSNWKKSFDELTVGDQKQVLQAHLNQQIHKMQEELNFRKTDILGSIEVPSLATNQPETPPITVNPTAQIIEKRPKTVDGEIAKKVSELMNERAVVEQNLSSKGYSSVELQQMSFETLQALQKQMEKDSIDKKVAENEKSGALRRIADAQKRAIDSQSNWRNTINARSQLLDEQLSYT